MSEVVAAMNNLEADAEAGPNFYYAVLRRREDTYETRLLANCLHHHRTREAAERCAERMAREFRALPA